MAIKIIRKKGITWKIDTTNIEKYSRIYRDAFGKSRIVYNAAWYLQKKAFEAMEQVYFETSGNLTKNKKRKSHYSKLESELFPNTRKNAPKALSGKYSYEISVVNDLATIERKVPHLKYQEKGTRASEDMQPYLIAYSRKRKGDIARRKYYPVKKINVNRYKEGRIVYLNVPHPALKSRDFIKAGNNFIRQNGQKIIYNYIRDFIKRKTQ